MNGDRSVDFSVIIAVYNGEKTLARAIDSVLEQTYPAREVIIVDDGSTDRTAEIASAYGPPVSLVRQPNLGVSAARNKGVESAKSEWITFLDADDYYYPERLELAAELIRRNPEVDFVTADFDYRDEEGGLLRSSLSSTVLGKKLLVERKGPFSLMRQASFGDFIEDHFGDTHTLTVPRSTFLELGGHPNGYAVCEDVHFLIRLCAASRLAGVICIPVAAYVIHSHSATRSDPLRAQRQTVAAWKSLEATVPRVLRQGYRKGLARARYNLAAALLKTGRRGESLAAILPLLYEAPCWDSLKKIASVARG